MIRREAWVRLGGAALVVAGGCWGGCAGGGAARDPALPVLAPNNIRAAHRLGTQAQRAERMGNTERAAQLYREALAESGDLHWVWNNLGVLLMQQDNALEAVAMFKTAAEISPTDPRPMENIALVYHNAGYDDRALEYYKAALARAPRSVTAHRGAALAGKRLRISNEDALARLETALMVETDPRWRQILEEERSRIRSNLAAKARSTRTGAR